MQKRIRHLSLVFFFLFSSVLYALESGDIVRNHATVSYTVHAVSKTVQSNEVKHTLVQSDAEISFLYATKNTTRTEVLGVSAYYDSNGVWHQRETSTLSDGTIIGNGRALNLEDTGFYAVDDTAIIRVEDADQNIHREEIDYIDVEVTTDSGDKERLRLVETGVNTGVFLAYLPLTSEPSVPYDSRLYVKAGETIVANYDNQSVSAKSDSAIVVLKKDLKLWIEKSVNKTEAGIGELLKYTLLIHNDEAFDIHEVKVVDALPLGLKYQRGTATLDGQKREAVLRQDGRAVFFTLANIKANSEIQIEFLTAITAGVHHGKVSNQAWVEQERFQSNIASVSTMVKEELMRSKGIIIGQVYDKNFEQNKRGHGVAGVRLYLENGMYVVTDKQGKYHFEGVEAGRHIVQVDKALLPEGYEMGTCQENARFAGKRFSQFVNVGRGALKRVDFCLHQREKTSQKPKEKAYVIPTKIESMPKYEKRDLLSKEKRAILWPPTGHVPTIPSVSLAIKRPKNERIDVWLNGYRVSKINYDGEVSSKGVSSVIEQYKGVDLLERGNRFKVEFFNRKNRLVKTLIRKVHVSSAPVKLEYLNANSQTTADGKNSPVLAVKFYDDAGQPLRAGVTGTFSVEAPYLSQDKLDLLHNNPMASSGVESRYTVHSEGIAYIKLQPTTESGEVILHFNLQGRDEVIRAWLHPAMREWIMVGFAEGTVGFNKLSGHQESLAQIGAEDKTIKEGRVSFFAKGQIKGEWLLSMAYDSGKETSKSEFFDEIDPNRYYTLYNDNSQQNQEAPSRKKLYLKLEKEQFNILFGDFSTDMTYTELASYSRRFTGIKGEHHGENMNAKGFIAHTEQLFVKDEIRGDGTSGYYYFKKQNILHFSEKIRIEVRNRYRAEEIIETKVLQRFRDYEIDYALGRVYFRAPIYSTDEKFNPRFIVLDYEIQGDGGKHYTYGGRTALKNKENTFEVGSSFIHEDGGKKRSDLMGVDTSIKVGANTRIKAEYAQTKTTQEGQTSKGKAQLAEIEHVANGVYARAYYREQEASFGLGQLSQALGGTRKIGLDLSQQFDNRQSHQLSFYRDTNLLNNINSDVFEFKEQYDNLMWDAFFGYRFSKQSHEAMAQQALMGASHAFLEQRLLLNINHEQTLGKDKSELYPTKTMIGSTYALTASTDVFASYEWAKKLEQGRVGVRFRPWSGMSVENTTLSEFSNDTQNIYNTIGAVQTYQVNESLALNVGFESGKTIKSTVLEQNLTGTNRAFNAYRVGVNYTKESYTATLNAEVRKGDNENKLNLSSGIYTQESDCLALALSGLYSKVESAIAPDRIDSNLQFSMAYRPEESDLIVLEKLDYIASTFQEAEGKVQTEKLINNMNMNLIPTSKSEVALQHGIKYVKDTLNSYEYKGITQLFGVDARYDLSKQWELGLQSSLLYAQSAKNMDYGFGVYSGHNLFENMLLTVGYNFKGFEDDDFSLQTYRMEGVYFRFNMKFDQESLNDTVRMLSW